MLSIACTRVVFKLTYVYKSSEFDLILHTPYIDTLGVVFENHPTLYSITKL